MKSMLFAILLLSTVACAQQTVTLTEDASVGLALEKNISVLQSKYAVDRSGAVHEQAVGAFLPTVSARGGFSRSQDWINTPGGYQTINGTPQFVPGGAGFFASNSYSVGIGANISYGLGDNYNLTASDQSAESATYSYKRTQQGTIFQTHSLFLNVFRTSELMKVSEDNLKSSSKQLEQIQESNKVGASAISDVYKQEVQVSSDQLSLIQAQSNYEQAKQNLLAYLGVELDKNYEFDFKGIPEDIDTTEFDAMNKQYANMESLVTSALSARPDYLSSIAAENSAESGVSFATANYYPTLGANASYGWNDPTLSGISNNKNLTLGVTVSLPIFNGFQTQVAIQEAEINQENSQAQVKQNALTLTVDIRKALLDLEASQKEVTTTKASVGYADLNRTIAQEKYHLGSGTLLDLLIAQAAYTQALSNKVNAVNDYLLAKKELEYALGTISK